MRAEPNSTTFLSGSCGDLEQGTSVLCNANDFTIRSKQTFINVCLLQVVKSLALQSTLVPCSRSP